jgi:Icc protein
MNFSFIQITDHHITASANELVNGVSTWHALRTVLKHIAQHVGNQADFIFSTGDLVEDPSEATYRAFLHVVQAQNAASEIPGPLFISGEGFREFPMYLLPGNHDDRDYFYKCLFPRSLPTPLMNVAFMHKGIQYICLDWGPHSKATLHLETLDFLTRCLETGTPSIILMHYHVVPLGSRWLDDFMADNMNLFWERVTGHHVLGIFCGHVHTSYEKVVHGIPVFGLRSTAPQFELLDEPVVSRLPPHYRLVTVQNGVLSSQIFEVPM